MKDEIFECVTINAHKENTWKYASVGFKANRMTVELDCMTIEEANQYELGGKYQIAINKLEPQP